jgi:hypothetical protein
MKIIGFVCEIDATCINVRAFSLGAFQKKTNARTLIQGEEISTEAKS